MTYLISYKFQIYTYLTGPYSNLWPNPTPRPPNLATTRPTPSLCIISEYDDYLESV